MRYGDLGYCVRQNLHGIYTCITCNTSIDSGNEHDAVATALNEILGREKKAIALVDALTLDIHTLSGTHMSQQRLDGLHFAIQKLVGNNHWTVYKSELLRFRGVLRQTDTTTAQVAKHIASLFTWLKKASLNPMHVLGMDFIMRIASLLREQNPMLAAKYYGDVLKHSSQYSAHYIPAVNGVVACVAEGVNKSKATEESSCFSYPNELPQTWCAHRNNFTWT